MATPKQNHATYFWPFQNSPRFGYLSAFSRPARLLVRRFSCVIFLAHSDRYCAISGMFRFSHFLSHRWLAWSTRSPSGNQVDGLPLVAHTGAGQYAGAHSYTYIYIYIYIYIYRPDCWSFIRVFLFIPLWEGLELFKVSRYIYIYIYIYKEHSDQRIFSVGCLARNFSRIKRKIFWPWCQYFLISQICVRLLRCSLGFLWLVLVMCRNSLQAHTIHFL